MTWVSHSVVTYATMFVVTHNVYIAGAAMLGSTFPDRIEGPLWQMWHRSYSHWFVLYVAVMAFLWSPDILSVNGPFLWKEGLGHTARTFFFWFFAGALLHIPEDAICGPVPFLYPTKRTTVLPRLFRVRSVGEFFFVTGYCMLLYLLNKWI